MAIRVFLIVAVLARIVYSLDVDPNGYVLYCPCMGRFGNQADHFLGALSFAHGLNRTLALPPWVVYPSRPTPTSSHVPFMEWFQVEPLLAYHRVVPMEDFMTHLAPVIWPPGKRYGFCYGSDNSQCGMKNGNPFGPFWNSFHVDFDGSVPYQIPYNTHDEGIRRQWENKFPPAHYPVIAFMGAPAAFPVAERDKYLQRYVRWSERIANEAKSFIARELPDGPFVAIHLRNGFDWERACEHVTGERSFMASPQCLGYDGPNRKVTRHLCFPPREEVLGRVKKAVKASDARGVFVATDKDAMINELTDHLKSLKVKVVAQPGSIRSPQLDLAILGQADHLIGNCVSSFTAFAVRERTAAGRTSSFFGFNGNSIKTRVEL
eukprot:m.48868 g.48868  ORF g.48868 m.48868 type:complete len:377 (+) comp33934_c1_seq2:426-1556(+)